MKHKSVTDVIKANCVAATVGATSAATAVTAERAPHVPRSSPENPLPYDPSLGASVLDLERDWRKTVTLAVVVYDATTTTVTIVSSLAMSAPARRPADVGTATSAGV